MNGNIHFVISSGSFKYVVTPSPNPNSIECYKDLLFQNGVTTVVRLCEKKYDDSVLVKRGINVIDISIPDGSVPDAETMKTWTNIISTEMKKNNAGIAVHCMSGLGRAPLFVCIGLIIFGNMNPIDALTTIRQKIPKAMNTKQVNYICTINAKKIRIYKNNQQKQSQCCIM